MYAINEGYFPFELPAGQTRVALNETIVISLVFLAFILLPFTYSLSFKLRKRERLFNVIIFFIGITLILLEIFKQMTYAKIYDYQKFGDYLRKIFPFQLCSLHMYLCPLAPFTKGKFRQTLLIFIGVYAFIGGIAVLGFSAGLNSVLWGFEREDGTRFGDYGMVVHTLLWHGILIQLGAFIFGFFHLGDAPYRKVVRLIFSSWGMCVFFGIIAEALNLFVPLAYGVDNKWVVGMNMWNVSRYYPVSMPVIGLFFDMDPWWLGGIIGFSAYMIVLLLGDFVVQTGLYYLIKTIRKYSNVVLYTRDTPL
jgi:VanZ family protein